MSLRCCGTTCLHSFHPGDSLAQSRASTNNKNSPHFSCSMSTSSPLAASSKYNFPQSNLTEYFLMITDPTDIFSSIEGDTQKLHSFKLEHSFNRSWKDSSISSLFTQIDMWLLLMSRDERLEQCSMLWLILHVRWLLLRWESRRERTGRGSLIALREKSVESVQLEKKDVLSVFGDLQNDTSDGSVRFKLSRGFLEN